MYKRQDPRLTRINHQREYCNCLIKFNICAVSCFISKVSLNMNTTNIPKFIYPARWVLRPLRIDQKRERTNISKVCSGLFQHNSIEFLRRFISVDETRIHYYTPEIKEQSKQWIEAGGNVSKKAKTVTSAVKIMVTIVWDAHGIIYIDYLFKKRKNNNRRVLCIVTGSIEERNQAQMLLEKIVFLILVNSYYVCVLYSVSI